ncbi:hypothetical protein ACQ4PT_037768 [Festuca glaucescens]
MAAHHLLLSVATVAVALLASPAAGEYPVANLQLQHLHGQEQVGAVPQQVWALALCRGDANASYCFTCLDQAFQDLPDACPYSRSAAVFYDSCVAQYSNIHSRPTDDTTYNPTRPTLFNINATVEPARFQRVVAALMNATVSYAVYNSTRLYASGEADFDQEFPKVYAWAQCTPDLTPERCRDCLVQNMEYLPTMFTGSIGARLLGVRCNYRYEMVRLPGTSASSRAPASAPAVTPATAAGEGESN